MAKTTMPASQFDQLTREAREVEAVLAMPGWKLIETEIRDQMEQIKTVLVENRIRTFEETTTSDTSTVTKVTTAETQIAENAGMYKMGQYLFELVDKIASAPSEVLELQRKGVVQIEKPEPKQASGGGEDK